MNPLDKAQIGSTNVSVTRLGVGGAPFGSMPIEAAEQSSIESIGKGLELGIAYYDTAPFYGAGRSERYYAKGLSGAERDSYVLSTKVGRVLNSGGRGARAGHLPRPAADGSGVRLQPRRDAALVRGKPEAAGTRPHSTSC